MLLLHGAMLAGPLVLLFAHSRFQVNALGICVFRAIFGVDCPACGITRSASVLFAGHIAQAFHFHPAGPLIVTIIAFLAIYFVIVLFTEFRGWEWRKEVKVYTGIEVLTLTALLVGWIGKVVVN